MSPVPAAIFTLKMLYLYLTLKILKKIRNLLATIPALQRQHHYHPSLSIIIILTSSTLNMSNQTFKPGHGYVPMLTEENYPIWK